MGYHKGSSHLLHLLVSVSVSPRVKKGGFRGGLKHLLDDNTDTTLNDVEIGRKQASLQEGSNLLVVAQGTRVETESSMLKPRADGNVAGDSVRLCYKPDCTDNNQNLDVIRLRSGANMSSLVSVIYHDLLSGVCFTSVICVL